MVSLHFAAAAILFKWVCALLCKAHDDQREMTTLKINSDRIISFVYPVAFKGGGDASVQVGNAKQRPAGQLFFTS